MKRLPAVLITAATAACALVVAGIYTGLLSFLADDNAISSDALWSIVTYWGLFCLAVLLITALVRRPRELALALVSVAMVLVLVEVALRITGVDRARHPYAGLSSSEFHHVNAANAEMFMGVYAGHPVVIRTNEDGMRTDYSREEFLKFGTRVLVMGDSFVWGMGVRQEHMLARVMEKRLREQLGSDDVAVITGANISYSPLLLERRYLEVYRRYRPTAVLLVLDASDIGDDIMYRRESDDGRGTHWDFPDERPSPYLAAYQLARPFLEWIGDNLAYPYYTFIHSGTFNYDYYDFELEVEGQAEKNRFFIYRHPLEATRQWFDSTLANVDAIADSVRSDGAGFTLVVAPRYNHWSDRECPDNWEVKQYKYGIDDPYESAYLDYFREAAGRVDYDVVPLLPAFEKAQEFPLVFRNDPHWNDAGHALVGRALADYLAGSGARQPN
jgi:hypothetical protein